MSTVIFLSCSIEQKILKKIQKVISQERRFQDDGVIGSIRNLSPHLNNNHTGRIHLMYSCRSVTNFMSNSATPWTIARQVSLSFTISQSLLKLMSAELVMPSNHLILYCPFSLLRSIFSSVRVFLDQVPKYWSFSFSSSPSNVQSGLISIRIDWFDLLAIQRTLKSLLQHCISKASIIWCSVFFRVQLYIHT